jgi:hypothetical protein
MTELELKRIPCDRRLYALESVGTLRLGGVLSRSATAEADGTSWTFTRRGFWQRVIQATDAAGTVVGEFVPRDLRRGGALRWAGRELRLRPASVLRERYALSDGDRELVVVDGRGWGRRPVNVSLLDPAAIDAGLLLFTVFVVHRLAVNAASSASAGSTAAVSGSAC